MGLENGTLEDTAIREGSRGPKQQDDAVYLMLAAELAGQRGQFDSALENYLKAAKLSGDARVAARAAQIALYLKKTDQALEAVSLWLAREPDNVEARRLSALLELKAGHADAALEQMAALLQLPGVDLEETLIEVVKLLGAELPKEAALDFARRLVERFPDLAEVHFAQALLAADKGEYQLALDETEHALALHPDWNRARLLQAQVMSQMGDSNAARETVLKALKKDPNNLRLRLIYSQFLAKSGNVAEAVKQLEVVLAKEPGNEDARFGLGMALLDSGKIDKAKQAFTRLSASSRWKTQSYFYLGLIEARKNRLSAALELFDKVTDGPLAFDAQVNGVTALINLGRLPEARARLATVRKRFPQEALRLYLLEAELLNKKKDYAAAFDLLTQGLEEMPGQVELLYTRALLAEQLDRVEVLEADLRAVLEKNPDDGNALNALGYTLADRYPDRLEEARKYLDKALELKPDEPAVHDSYGWLLYRLGDYEGALSYLRRAYEAVADPEIGAHLGEVLWESGKQAEARKVWRESYKKDPEHGDIKRIRERYPEAFR
ncbi:tetratricopeptide repeat protein [Methylococcus sp. EFPC2]|uniref:tetratricopeptide repeat protein n=1 Tax=Methylococcus sp. EFPC2 TaxID=2812648 RepID=UPI001F07ACCC|nr:tetratricopeptide repeat protein [Methylococcus sp. EFPC2]